MEDQKKEEKKVEVKQQKISLPNQKTFYFHPFRSSASIDRQVNSWMHKMVMSGKPVMLGKITANIFGSFFVFLFTTSITAVEPKKN